MLANIKSSLQDFAVDLGTANDPRAHVLGAALYIGAEFLPTTAVELGLTVVGGSQATKLLPGRSSSVSIGGGVANTRISLAYDISKWGEYGLPSDGYFARTLTPQRYRDFKIGLDFKFGGSAGLSVRVKGVLIAVEEYWNGILPKRRFKLYSSLSSAELCGQSLGIIPSNDKVYNFLLENDGKIIEVVGEIGGSQNPYIRYIEVDRIPLYALKAERLTECGKIPPAPPPPPAPNSIGMQSK